MSIDRLLSRFKIQTKVLFFILPFVASVIVIGLTGLYASGLLQTRMEISNSVLQSLSGFREVSASMVSFLEKATAERRDSVSDGLKAQRAVLETMQSQLGDNSEGRADLEAAAKSVDGVTAQIDGLWTLHENETKLRAEILGNLDAMVAAKKSLVEEVNKMQKSVREQESAAKNILREVEAITSTSQLLNDVSGQFGKLPTPAEKFEFIKKNLAEMRRRSQNLVAILPNNAKVTTALNSTLKLIIDVIESKDTSETAIATIASKLNLLRQQNIYLGLAAAQKMREATQKFTELDLPLAKSEKILNSSKTLVETSYDIQIELARFMLEPTAANLESLTGFVTAARTNIAALARRTKGIDAFTAIQDSLLPIFDGITQGATSLVTVSNDRQTKFATAAADIDAIWQKLTAFAEQQKQSASAERENANGISTGAMVVGIIISIFAGIGLVMTFKGPIGQITSAMRKLAEGILDTSISGESRADEIGEMARALGVFKQNAVAKIEIEQQSEAQRAAAEEERRRNDAEKQDIDRQIDFAVNSLAGALERLAHGDLNCTINTTFTGGLDKLRGDFNTALSGLRSTMVEIRAASGMVQDNGAQMAEVADELSKRTEQQAAALEQTAAAVEQITATVRNSEVRTSEVQKMVGTAKKSAEHSSNVVKNAVSAMQRINAASEKISQIIEVIDGIAFQTNLLALNAGVEAARAGDAGKGFAVVAQEVRELAQRSAKAAKEIDELIGNSAKEVDVGSRHVEETGQALMEIARQIVDISGHVDMIAIASREQSTSLQEINSSVNAMDQMTQRNAAMVEETNAASRDLAHEADTLMNLVGRFTLDEQATYREHRAA